jgi:hypothetical protein
LAHNDVKGKGPEGWGRNGIGRESRGETGRAGEFEQEDPKGPRNGKGMAEDGKV